jgi:hypothetical protein
MCRARDPGVFTQGFCFCDNPIPPPASEILTARASRQRSGNRHAVSVAVLRADLSAPRCGGLLPLRRIGSEAAVGPDRRLTCLLRLVGPAFCRPACRAIVLTWLLALARECSKSRALLIAGIALNLLSLDTFKYLDFILGSIESAPNRRPAPAARRLQCAKNIGTRESSPNPLPPPLSADERRRMSFPALVWLDARLAHCQPTAARFWP